MPVSVRSYIQSSDYEPVADFLVAQYREGNRDGNWLQARWEYMHSHPNLDETVLDRIGLWERQGQLIGVINYEDSLGYAYPQLHSEHLELRAPMLEYAESHLALEMEDGSRQLKAYLYEADHEYQAIAEARGYVPEGGIEPMSILPITGPIERPAVPDGFRIKSLREENSLNKIHRVMWRGFNHPGEPPEEGIAWRLKMQSGPNFRPDLNIVVEAPDGNFVAYAGLWSEPVNRVAFVEPVATDPDYRRMGLGRAAVLEGIRRCAAEGATVAYVGSEQPFYLAIGFTKIPGHRCWIKRW